MIGTGTARRFARLTLGHIGQEYPNHITHLMRGPTDALTPSAMHPIFYGSLDWHSCVHGWWQLLTLARHYPAISDAETIRRAADAVLTPEKVLGEIAYFQRPGAGAFERPYGWAWALALQAEAEQHDTSWGAALKPLAELIADRFEEYLRTLTYAVRSGAHFNTAFALILALQWAKDRRVSLAMLITERAHAWFIGDQGCQAWEPGGEDFLSPTLVEALLMSQILGSDFALWFDRFLPDAAQMCPYTLFNPVHVSDRRDGKIAHLDGLNLSRAWCWRGIAVALGDHHRVSRIARICAQQHLDASLPYLAGDYMGEHWLATFALLALSFEYDVGRE